MSTMLCEQPCHDCVLNWWNASWFEKSRQYCSRFRIASRSAIIEHIAYNGNNMRKFVSLQADYTHLHGIGEGSKHRTKDEETALVEDQTRRTRGADRQ